MRFLGVFCLSLLPLQWFVVLGSPVGGNIRVHQLAILVLAAAIILTYGFKQSEEIIYRFRVFLIANAYMYMIWVCITFYQDMIPLDPFEEMIYMVIFLSIAVYFFQAATSDDVRFVQTLRWTGPLCLLVLIGGLIVGSIQNHVDIVGVIAASIAAADPNIIEFQLFRRVFGGFGFESDDVRANFRHEIFGGLLLSLFITGWAATKAPFRPGREQFVYRMTMVGGTAMVLLSLSRSIIIAGAVWPVLLVIRALLTGRISQRNQLTGVLVLIAAVVAGVFGVWQLLYERFFESTASYDTRAGNAGLALQTIKENFWIGKPDLTGETSAHNFVLDAWSGAGAFVGFPALIVFLSIVLLWATLLLRIETLSDEMLVICAAFALPSIRMVTQGGGLLALVEWVTLGFIAGALVAHDRTERKDSDKGDDKGEVPAAKPQSQLVQAAAAARANARLSPTAAGDNGVRPAGSRGASAVQRTGR